MWFFSQNEEIMKAQIVSRLSNSYVSHKTEWIILA